MAVYLLHASGKLGTSGKASAQHYLGYAPDGGVIRRVEFHRTGRSDAAIVRSFVRAGHALYLARVWPGAPRSEERRMKRGGHYDLLCPTCRAAKAVEG